MGGVAGFFDKELKNSRIGILKESENIHVWFQNCYSFNNLVSIYTKWINDFLYCWAKKCLHIYIYMAFEMTNGLQN